jgi:hypothetical protein
MSGMETCPPPRPAFGLSTELCYQLVYTLTDQPPPPLDDTPEALHVRNRAAIAKLAALLPVNANEADLAAQCIAAPEPWPRRCCACSVSTPTTSGW